MADECAVSPFVQKTDRIRNEFRSLSVNPSLNNLSFKKQSVLTEKVFQPGSEVKFGAPLCSYDDVR